MLVFRLPTDPPPPPRKNVPVAVVAYSNPADKFAQTEPSISKATMDKEGNLGMDFSVPMAFPKEWKDREAD